MGVDASPEPNCVKKTKFGVFTSVNEAKAAGLLPEDAIIHRMLLKSRTGKELFATFSASKNRSYLAWSKDWAKPLGFIDLSDEHMAYACDHGRNKVHIAYGRNNVATRIALGPIPGFTPDMT